METSSLSSSTTSKTLNSSQFPSIPNKLIMPTRKSFPVANYSSPPDHHIDGDPNQEITQSPDKATKPIVLKMSFKQHKAAPENPDKVQTRNTSPSYDEWSEWEREVFKQYYDDIFEAMELLRLYMASTRPSVAMGVLALVAVAVPLTTPAAVSSALNIARALLQGYRVCIDVNFL